MRDSSCLSAGATDFIKKIKSSSSVNCQPAKLQKVALPLVSFGYCFGEAA
jgi:hypothetical protein